MQTKQVFVAPGQQKGTPADHPGFCPKCGARLARKTVDGRERDVCSECNHVVYRNPLPAVSVLIVREGKVLLGRRHANSIYPGLWCLPCGFVEHDEDFLAAAIREAREETGLDIVLRSIVNVAHNFLPGGVHTLVPVVLAEVTGGVARPGDDIVELRWLEPTDPLPQLAFEADAHIIERYRSGALTGLPVDERHRTAH